MKNDMLNALSETEKLSLYKAPVYVALYAALQDGHIDKKELDDAVSLVHIRTFASDVEMRDYYRHAENQFEEKLEAYKLALPRGKNLALKKIESDLDELEAIIKKLDKDAQVILRGSLKSFGEHVATSTRTWMDGFALFMNPFLNMN